MKGEDSMKSKIDRGVLSINKDRKIIVDRSNQKVFIKKEKNNWGNNMIEKNKNL